MTPLLTQSWTLSTDGALAMSGRLVPASTLIASWLASRTVVRWTLMPVSLWNGFKTSWNALSSAPPQALQTETSVDPALGLDVPPDEQATMRSNAPRPMALAFELSIAKIPAIPALLLTRPRPGPVCPAPVAFFPGADRGESAPATRPTPRRPYGTPRRTFALVRPDSSWRPGSLSIFALAGA